MGSVAKLSWNVYAKMPFKKGQHVLDYLGRYTHRVGIANSRLLDVSERAVTFRTKGQATETVSPVEFLRRFVQHVLPDGFHKIRHIGLYATASAARREIARAHLGAAIRTLPRRNWPDQLAWLTGRDVALCPRCAARLFTVILPRCRAPPTLAA
jgi:Putative transposase